MSIFESFSLLEIIDKIKTGKVTPLQLVQKAIERIEQVDDKVTAWEIVDKERAIEVAEKRTEEAKRGTFKGLFHGIPVAIKDIIDVEGLPTKHNCQAFADALPAKRDASIVAKLKEQGAIILGKAHTAELAYFDPSPTKNPYHLEHTPGGSSSGSAAAVAANMVPFSVGTQTNASVARPAAYNGVGGYRPTTGTLSLDGILSFSPSFDSLGFFGKTFQDACLGYSLIDEQYDWKKATEKRPLYIGVVSDPLYEKATIAVKAALELAEDTLKKAGHKLEVVTPPVAFQDIVASHETIMTYEAGQQFKELVTKFEAKLGKKFVALIKKGETIAEREYEEARAFMEAVRKTMQSFLERFDLLLVPPTDSVAPKDLTTTGNPLFTTPWTYIGTPLAVFPVALDDNNLPVSIMFTAARHRDEELIEHSRQLEKLFPRIPEPNL